MGIFLILWLLRGFGGGTEGLRNAGLILQRAVLGGAHAFIATFLNQIINLLLDCLGRMDDAALQLGWASQQ